MRKWLVSAAAAAFHPRGFHYRGVLVLIGGQGIGKTTWFRNLAGRDEFFNEGIGLELFPSGLRSWASWRGLSSGRICLR